MRAWRGFARREDYAAGRRAELHRALALAAIEPQQISSIALADQEAAFHLPFLSFHLARILARARVDAVLTHPYEGGHPDHDATAFAVHAAIRLLQEEGRATLPIIEMTSYHNRAGAIATEEFLPWPGPFSEPLPTPLPEIRAVNAVLDENERRLKRRMLDCFVTQHETLRWFSPNVERFRLAPDYDFTRPPHEGTLFYEYFDWGMSARRWCTLARAAFEHIKLRVTVPP